MYSKILVPLDGSELAERALQHAKEPAVKLGTEVILAHVCSLEECGFEADKRNVSPMHRVYVEHTSYMFAGALESVGSRNAKVGWEVLAGDPATEIMRYSEENNISIIIMTTHGRSGIKDWIRGSVADRVVRNSGVPVRLVRVFAPDDQTTHFDWHERNMLVLLDGSNTAEQVLPYVSQHAKMSGAEVTILRVSELSDEEQVVKEYLGEIERQFKDDGMNVKSEILKGKAADEIVDYVNNNPFNIIAMTTHGHSGLSRWAVGNVTDKVLHATSSSLLLIRAQ